MRGEIKANAMLFLSLGALVIWFRRGEAYTPLIFGICLVLFGLSLFWWASRK